MAFRIELTEPASSFEAEAGDTLLAAAERAGVHMPRECRVGTCGTCRVHIAAGRVDYEEWPSSLSPQEAEQGYALSCQARPCSNLVLTPERRLAPCSEVASHAATVSAIRAVAHDVVHLQLELPPDAGEIVYRPGQYANLRLQDGQSRSFSMASPRSGRLLDFHIRRIPGGRFTHERVAALRPGDRLEIELPHGTFCHHPEDYRPMLFVATGTGLAPLKSIAESLMESDDTPPIALYWGARTEEDLYLRHEVAQWCERFDEFSFTPVLSRPSPSWQGRTGYVQQAVAEDFPDLSEHAIYLCGSAHMVRDAREMFLALGASRDHVYSDAFTFQSGGRAG